MSWLMARDSVITNIFSLSSTPVAGRLFGILMGTVLPPVSRGRRSRAGSVYSLPQIISVNVFKN
jgi:hypothetical protein